MHRYFIVICLVFVNVSVVFAQSLVNISGEEALAYSVDQMSLEEKVGQLFMVPLRQKDGKLVITATGAIKAEIQKYHLGGIILFGENFIDIEQTVTLTTDLQQAAGPIPLFIAVDQEGGRVNRFHFDTNLPGNMALGASGW